MFTRILQWIREVLNRMIGTSSIKQSLGVDVAISPYMATSLMTWSLMYLNRAAWLYQGDPGGGPPPDLAHDRDLRSLNLPAAIAGEIARAVTIEMKVAIEGSPRAVYLAEQFENIQPKLRQMVEYGAAKGGLMFKPYLVDDQIKVDYIQADMFYPIAFDANGNITSCVFADQRTIGNKFYTRLEYHNMTPEGCEIRNLAFKSDSISSLGQPVPLASIDEWAELQPEATITGIDRPLFAYFRYPMANNVDPTSPLGVSCYSRVVELIHDADRQWSELLWEFESGERAIYVDADAFTKDKKGNPVLPHRRLYRTMAQGGDLTAEEMFHEWTPDFREQNILAGLEAMLKKIEFNCGLAYGTLSDPNTVDKTATEIVSSRQRSYATITDTQKSLRGALEQLLWSMDQWATIGTLAPRGAYTMVIDFDDSVIVDKDMQMQADRQTTTMGAMPKYIFLMRNYGLDEKTAKQWIADNLAEQPADLFNNPQGA